MRRTMTLGRTGLATALSLTLLAGPAAAGSPSPSPSGSPSPSPSGSRAPAPAIVWDSGSVRLTADAVRITAGGRVFTGQVPQISIHSDPGDATYRTLELDWQELGVPMRLRLYFAADRTSWWVTEVRTSDALPAGDWVSYPGPFWRTPIGGSWHGEVHLTQGPSGLDIQGMTLTAFLPATIPAQLRFCRSALPAGESADSTDPLAAGQPLAGTGIEAMSPPQAQALLRSRGFCYTFRYDTGSYSEVWCDPPPGVIDGLVYGSDGELIVFVSDATPQLHTPRPQPPVGWGC